MANEIEIKILEIQFEKLEKQLIDIGAHKTFEGDMDAICLDFDTDYIRNKKDSLRLRREGDKTFLAYKVELGKNDAKRVDELQIEVSDFAITKTILEHLGLKKYNSLLKHRVSYAIEDGKHHIHFDIDTYLKENSHVPTFLEIESDANEPIFKYAKLLGFKKEQCLNWTTKDVLTHYAHLASKK